MAKKPTAARRRTPLPSATAQATLGAKIDAGGLNKMSAEVAEMAAEDAGSAGDKVEPHAVPKPSEMRDAHLLRVNRQMLSDKAAQQRRAAKSYDEASTQKYLMAERCIQISHHLTVMPLTALGLVLEALTTGKDDQIKTIAMSLPPDHDDKEY